MPVEPERPLSAGGLAAATHTHLAVLLLRLGQARDMRAAADLALQRADLDDAERETHDARFSRADGLIDALEGEARASVERATGVPWDIIEAAGL